MSLLIKSKFWNKSSNVIIDYSDKAFTTQKKELFKSGTLYRKGNKLLFKQNGVLNTTNNSNEKTDYMNNYHEVKLISIEKKGDSNYVVDCGEWSKDINELIEQNATYFLYKGSTIENFMKDKHRYHILSQGDIIKIGKIYLKVLHIKLNKPESKNVKTSSNKDDSDNNNQSNNNNSNNNENNEVDNENNENNKSTIKNDLIIEGEPNQNQSNKKKIKKRNTNFSLRNLTESLSQNNGKILNNKNINRSMEISQKLNLTQRTIDINSINEGRNLSYIKQSKKWKKSRNKNDPKKNKETDKDKEKLIKEKSNQKIKIKNKICRICFNGESNPTKNPLICPCICKGSMKYIHYLCLKNWLNLKVESELGRRVDIEKEKPTITYNKNEIRCELCKSKFPDYVRHNDKLYNVSFYKPKYEQFIVFESVRNDNRRSKFIHIIPLNSYSMHRIGRLNNCDLSLPDNSVSRVHCCLYIENSQLVLENNSKYGTKVLIQNPKLNIVSDYPLCIETQNTYLKIFVKKSFQFFCCGDSTKSYVRMHPYQSQNQKGFDLFCSMVFKSDDENDSEDEKEENDEGGNNINLIDNNNNDENIKKDEEDKKIKENKKDNGNTSKKNKDKSDEIKSNIDEDKDKDKEQYLETKKQEKNLININIKDEDKLIEESNIKNVKKDISIINQNLKANLIENDNNIKEQLIDESIKKVDNKNSSVFISKDNEESNIIKSETKKDLISIEHKSNDKLIQTDIKPKNKIDKNFLKFNNKETKNPIENLNLIQLEGEEKQGKKNKNIINFFNNHETIKNLVDKINKNSIDNESNQSNENNNKSNKYINLDQINNLSYKVEKDKIYKNNISVINNYESIFGLLPNDKNESSLLLAPKHNKNIKFGNYDIHSEADKISNQKSGNKMWNKFNWNFK